MGGVAWSEEEDNLLKKCIEQYGEGKWHRIPFLAGLNRCRKSCRLRWLNYLRPNIKRGSFSQEEVDIIIKLHKLLGNRWSLIAGRLPGRTANDVKNFWNCHCKKLLTQSNNTNINNQDKPMTEEGQTSTTLAVLPPFLYAGQESHSLMGNNNNEQAEDGVFGDLPVMDLEFKDVANNGMGGSGDVTGHEIYTKWDWDDLSIDMDLFLNGAL